MLLTIEEFFRVVVLLKLIYGDEMAIKRVFLLYCFLISFSSIVSYYRGCYKKIIEQ